MNNYDDIINLEHYEPKYHKRMNILSRASQFAPFAALNGYEDNINEAKRFTNKKVELTNEEKLKINDTLLLLKKNIKIKVIYFLKDKTKSGGKYITYIGYVSKLDSFNKRIIFNDNTIIYFDNIMEIEI